MASLVLAALCCIIIFLVALKKPYPNNQTLSEIPLYRAKTSLRLCEFNSKLGL